MKWNLFGTVYQVHNEMFHDMEAENAISQLRDSIEKDIAANRIPDKMQYLLFKMTNHCNSDCEYCSHRISNSANEIKSDIPFPLIKQTIDDAAALGCETVAINGGEPLLMPDIYKILQTIIDDKMVPVLMTNGILLPKMWDKLGELGLRYVIISFDSIQPDVYKKQRGISFEKALAGLNAACQMMEKYDNVHVHVSAVLTRDNQDDFIELVKYMSSRGIATQISPYHHYNPHEEDNISITDRKKCDQLVKTLLQMKDDGYLISSSRGFIEHLSDFFCNKMRVPKDYRCLIGYTNLFVDAYMNVRPCWDWCFKPLGNLKEMRLSEIWNGEQMKEYREKMLRCECDGCWYMCTGEVSMMIEDRM